MKSLWRGNANAWECDELGHLNVKFYLAKAMQAVAHLAHEAGLDAPFRDGASATLILRELHINFIAEARPGAALSISGGIRTIADSEMTAELVMSHADGGPAAGFTLTLDHAVPSNGQAFRWPARFTEKAQGLMVPVPEACQANGLPPADGRKDVSLKRANALDLREIGRGMFGQEDCDSFGFMRPEVLFGKVSDSAIHLREAFPEESESPASDDLALAGALLECRIRVKRRPRAGDLFVIRSGLIEAGPSVRKLAHWVLDPVSGRPWWTTEGVAAMLDLKARRIRKAEGALLDTLRAGCRTDFGG